MKKNKTKIAIYGLGLIGSSLGLSLKNKGYERIGIGRNKKKLALAARMGVVDYTTTDLKKGLHDADIVVLAVPVGLIIPLLRKIKPFIKKNTVVTDVGSVKGCIMDSAKKILPTMFVGSHPMAGSEKSGCTFARKDLFKGAGCVVVKGNNPSWAVQKIVRIWKETGSKIIFLDKNTHDHLVAICSHLPHIFAYAMMTYVKKVSKKNKFIFSMAAGSFKDMTRVAMSSPDLWAQISVCNKSHIRSSLHEFRSIINHIVSLLDNPKRSACVYKEAAELRSRL